MEELVKYWKDIPPTVMGQGDHWTNIFTGKIVQALLRLYITILELQVLHPMQELFLLEFIKTLKRITLIVVLYHLVMLK